MSQIWCLCLSRLKLLKTLHCALYSAMELSYFLIDAFINQSTYLAQFDALNLNRQFVNSLVNRLIFFSGFLKVEFVIQWRITTVVAIMNALEPVTRKSNCITGIFFLELFFLKVCVLIIGELSHGPLLLDRSVCLPLFAMRPSFGYFSTVIYVNFSCPNSTSSANFRKNNFCNKIKLIQVIFQIARI